MATLQQLFSFPDESPRVSKGLQETGADTDKNTDHSYGPIYEVLLADYFGVNGHVGTIAEVGVYRGGSIALWQHLCPNMFVIGIDTADHVTPAMRAIIDPTRYLNIHKDAYCAQTFLKIREFAPFGLDFAIDDGPHTDWHQAMFLKLYLPLLKPGGIAVIEDVQHAKTITTLAAEIPDGWHYQVEDRYEIKHRYDDRLLIVQRPR
jgi:hypothetical protein